MSTQRVKGNLVHPSDYGPDQSFSRLSARQSRAVVCQLVLAQNDPRAVGLLQASVITSRHALFDLSKQAVPTCG